MKPIHPDDDSIQKYALEQETCDKEVIQHLSSCAYCQEIAETYRAMANELKAQEKPVLSSQLEDQIMRRIMSQKVQKLPVRLYGLAGPLFVLIVGLASLIISTLASGVKNLVALEHLSLYVIIGIGICVTVLLAIDIIKTHQYHMNKISFS